MTLHFNRLYYQFFFNKNHFDREYVNILTVINRLIKIIKYIFINKIDVIFITRVFYL